MLMHLTCHATLTDRKNQSRPRSEGLRSHRPPNRTSLLPADQASAAQGHRYQHQGRDATGRRRHLHPSDGTCMPGWLLHHRRRAYSGTGEADLIKLGCRWNSCQAQPQSVVTIAAVRQTPDCRTRLMLIEAVTSSIRSRRSNASIDSGNIVAEQPAGGVIDTIWSRAAKISRGRKVDRQITFARENLPGHPLRAYRSRSSYGAAHFQGRPPAPQVLLVQRPSGD